MGSAPGRGSETLFLNDGITAEGIHAESGAQEFYTCDEYGSPVRYTDEYGNTTGLFGYEEYGVQTDLFAEAENRTYGTACCNAVSNPLFETSGSRNRNKNRHRNGNIHRPFTFTGYMGDEVSGLYFAQAREYDPADGRFAGKDWVKGFADRPYTLNEYGYCWNNPTMFVDTDGKMPTTPTSGSLTANTGSSTGIERVSYVFYISDWKSEAQRDAMRISNVLNYRSNNGAVIPIELSDNQSFIDAWNNMGKLSNGNYVDVDIVEIKTHGDPVDGLMDGQANPLWITPQDIKQSLNAKKIEQLLLFGCNAGHSDYSTSNPAYELALKVSGAPVLASDGTVYANAEPNYSSKVDNTWSNLSARANGGTARSANDGFVVYQLNGGSVKVTTTGTMKGYNTDLIQLLTPYMKGSLCGK